MLAVFTSPLAAQDSSSSQSADRTYLFGAGVLTCAQFGEEYRRRGDLAELQYFTWAQGFMSAMNSANASEGHPTADLNPRSIDRQLQWLRQYCDSHPLSSYSLGVALLYHAIVVGEL
jgi:hypothetical protein